MTNKLPQLYIMNVEQKIELLQKHGYTINGDEDSEEDLDYTIEGDVESGVIDIRELQ